MSVSNKAEKKNVEKIPKNRLRISSDDLKKISRKKKFSRSTTTKLFSGSVGLKIKIIVKITLKVRKPKKIIRVKKKKCKKNDAPEKKNRNE
jgi:hypothetical protein